MITALQKKMLRLCSICGTNSVVGTAGHWTMTQLQYGTLEEN